MAKFYFSKWLTYSSACLIMSSAGLAYTFSVYSDSIKHKFNYSQTQLAGIGTAGNIGGYLSIFSGIFYDRVKHYDRYTSYEVGLTLRDVSPALLLLI